MVLVLECVVARTTRLQTNRWIISHSDDQVCLSFLIFHDFLAIYHETLNLCLFLEGGGAPVRDATGAVNTSRRISENPAPYQPMSVQQQQVQQQSQGYPIVQLQQPQQPQQQFSNPHPRLGQVQQLSFAEQQQQQGIAAHNRNGSDNHANDGYYSSHAHLRVLVPPSPAQALQLQPQQHQQQQQQFSVPGLQQHQMQQHQQGELV